MKICSLQSLLCVVISFFALSAGAQQQILYSHGDPSDGEQYMLELINRARAYPAAEGVTLAREPDPSIQGFYKANRVNLSQLQQEFKSYAAKPPLAFNGGLISVASRHSQYMIDNNFETHYEIYSPSTVNDKSYTGPDPLTRIQSVFPNLLMGEENAYTYVPNLNFADAGFLVDWGVPNLGHRTTIMGLSYQGTELKFNQIGIGLVANNTHTPYATPAVTEDFALDNQVFLTGVVYQDLNHDGFYNQGKGLAGVTIRPSVGTHYAVTSSSGGYAIPIDPALINSSFSVTASGPGVGADITKSISMSGNNGKMDFVPNELPTPITLATRAPSKGTPHEILVTRTFNRQSVLNLRYKMSGDALNGIDYKMLPGLLQFPGGVSTMILKIKSKITDSTVHKTVVLRIKNGPMNEGGVQASVVIGG